jgi:hypothetical protein
MASHLYRNCNATKINSFFNIFDVVFPADRNLRVYSTAEGKFQLLKTIQARDVGWSILDTAFSPDGNYVVYSSWSECRKFLYFFSDE